MKIIRYQDSHGAEHYGAEENGQQQRIEGDIYGDYTVTEEVADVAKLLAPIVPEIIWCIGLNYKYHAQESKMPIPERPVLFVKSASATQNPGDPLSLIHI